MAFNFNWSPLTADAEFYQRAREMLTTALNKSPKPPIIVDDILVTEFNLGSVPPELEILEIGDIAEDRFRGIFKMCYSGDAFLTLKTRVQANPMNTYSGTKPDFTSPSTLSASSGLTIPLSITLSEIKLSAFIILVFSRQKGLTLVFRNDPLESLKVSSTFDSIQFVRDYLQRTIESQLRNLMMEELPAIIHRLSLRLWCPESLPKEEDAPKENSDEAAVDPLASPPLDPVDANGNLLDANDVSSLSLEGGPEVQSLFSQKNLLRLAALNDSNRTFSLFTPGIRNVVFRAWTGPAVSESSSSPPTATPSLSKTNSFLGTSTTYTFSDTGSASHGHLPSRPSLVSLNSATTGLSLGAGTRSKSYAGRKKKTRVVNLRRSKSEINTPEGSDGFSDVASDCASVAGPSTATEPLISSSIAEDPEEEEALAELANSTPSKVRFSNVERPHLTSRPPLQPDFYTAPVETPSAPIKVDSAPAPEATPAATTAVQPTEKPRIFPSEKAPVSETSSVSEQAWIMKMAGEIARRVYDEKNRQQGIWDEREDVPPPAYEAST
ncbi:Mitochondrial distribution and morphology protein 34 [Colletotrichum spinosum]|uniref:Mitochondrial distribution and morphology protein 34 n=1 Tax=Colletotrichum spinosum TaxID=1347390 RepID=A0A4R8PU26_9PEZI|nr:Mitochondrial distribution and morphology protein 34 [Colletotrichum spinosum]